MAIIVMNYHDPLEVDYKSWLSFVNEDIHLLTKNEYANHFPGYIQVKGYENYSNNPVVELDAYKLFEQHQYKYLIALDEGDIIRAARIRDRFNIDGQNFDSALAFRDKITMKSHLQGVVPCAVFQKITSVIDVLDFIKKHDFPVVVKPTSGMGSIDTHIIYNDQQLEALFPIITRDDLMIEKYVKGDMYSIDGIYANNQLQFASVCRYVNGCLSVKNGKGEIKEIVSTKEEIYSRLVEFTRLVLKTLPSPEVMAFHCEIFLTPEGEVVFNEIGSRTAQSKVPQCIEQSFGINLNKIWTQLCCGMPLASISKDLQANQECLSAAYLIPKQSGILGTQIENFPFEWVTDYYPFSNPGEVFQGSYSCGDTIGIAIIKGENRMDLQQKYTSIEHFISENIGWK